ncbi:universal stress protein [Rufibacter sediminis]|uniref:Universal stress protein n=1 Tax=Rufibacter sediminis TaxID=2762756 RepID=A0ABR6VVC5_9BACT|nr:universal stress protein [Rufibacter sediminis]MBC3541156.1 universal stress protein [Rufibacter sediminis]
MKLLVTTDHSREAHQAFLYALDMAVSLKAEVILLQVFHQQIPLSQALHPQEYVAALEAEKTRQLENYAQALQAERSHNFSFRFHAAAAVEKEIPADFSLTESGQHYLEVLPDAQADLPIRCVAKFGNASEKILEFMDDLSADLVLMGTHGGGDLSRALLGSVVTEVILNATVPVLVVPSSAEFTGLQTLAFAADLHQLPHPDHLTFLGKLAEKSSARLEVLHLYHSEKEEELQAIQQGLNQLDSNVPVNFSVHFRFTNQPEKAIREFVSTTQPDLLVVAPHHHTYLDIVRHKSITGDLTAQPLLPLLALPASAGQQPASLKESFATEDTLLLSTSILSQDEQDSSTH